MTTADASGVNSPSASSTPAPASEVPAAIAMGFARAEPVGVEEPAGAGEAGTAEQAEEFLAAMADQQ